MMAAIEPFWDDGFRIDARPFGPPSTEILELLDRLPRRARVLDLGCGDGRNAIPLARAGHIVTAVDVSKNALASLRRQAAREGSPVGSDGAPLGMELVQADLATFCPLDDYDLVIAHGVLHLLERADRNWLMDRFRKHTRPGGWNVVVAFTRSLPPPPELARFCRGLFDEGELFRRYGDWELERAESYVKDDEHPGGIRHRHPINKVVARRPLRDPAGSADPAPGR